MKKLVLIACGLFLAYGGKAQAVNDVGISGITSPNVAVPTNSSQPVSVTMRNFNASQVNSATLGFSVNGVVQPTYAWTGTLAGNATSAVITLGNFTFPAGTHILKAWTKLPNATADVNAANDTMQLTIKTCTVMSGNYTINKTAPASATNFTSISDAAAALGGCGVSGPVTITVVPNTGPYNEQVVLPIIAGTSAANTVTFEGNGNTVSAGPASTNPNLGIITLDGADYVKINKFNIVLAAGASAGWGIQLKNTADNNIITNNTLDLPLSSTSSSINGIVIGAGGIGQTAGNNASNTTIQNNIVNGGYNGIAINGNTGNVGAVGNLVKNNQVKNSSNYGIYLNNVTNNNIEGNDISRPTRTNNNNFYGIYLIGASTNTVISKNQCHNTHDMAASTGGTVYGIYVSGVSPAAGSEIIIKNNLIYNVNCVGGTFYGLYTITANGLYFYHNTISADNMAISYSVLRGLHFNTAATNIKFINNIISLSAPATAKHAIYMTTTSGMSVISDYNDLFMGKGQYNIGYYSGDKPWMFDWQGVNSKAYDQHSVSVDPAFVNPTSNMLPLSAGVNNNGQALASVADDINGAIRSTTAPDMGAIEFTPIVNDAGITAITSPTSPVSPGTQQVQVTLKNFGTANLTTATVRWSVNGVVQPNYSWSGNLNSFQSTATPVNIGSYNFAAGNHVLKVWSQNPNGATDGYAPNDTTILQLVCGVPMAGAYTVNQNVAVSATNFQSISAAALKLGTYGVSAPVTVTVVPNTGPYNEQVEFVNIPFISATNTVTFEGSGNTVSAAPATTNPNQGIFTLNGADYIKINNFNIALPAAATSGWGIQLKNIADNNIISNNTLDLPLSFSSNINGIVIGNGTTTAGNNASNTTIQNNTINGGYYGITINGNTGNVGAVGNQVKNNQVKDFYFYGINLNNVTNNKIEGNDLSTPNRTSVSSTAFYGIYLQGASSNTVISKNRIHNTHDKITSTGGSVYGIAVSNASPAAGSENIIKNNLIYNINCAGGSLYALWATLSNGLYFYHNTISADNMAINYNILRGMHFHSSATNIRFINNIMSLTAPATTKHAFYVVPPSAVALTSDNNDLFLGTSGSIGYISFDQVTLADWKAVNGYAYDQNSIAADPVFASVATGNLKPTAVALDNIGQPIAAVTDDILGAARNTTTPDPGAYEFGVPANDVGITSVSVSNATNCSISATESVTITIKNFGSSTQTSIPVSYSVNGVAIAASETFSGSIAPNATVTYAFNTKANLSASGTYVITTKTLLPGDITTSNDADTVGVTNAMVSTIPFTFDFETANTGISRFRKVTNAKSNITEGVGASNSTVLSSAKGMIMDGVTNSNWTIPVGTIDPWTSNPDNFSASYFCINPAGGAASDSLWLTLDLKQLFKTISANTNFRVTVNGTQLGTTYRPPFNGTGGTANWTKVKVDLTAFKNDPTVSIGLESSVKEEYANGTGTANLIDNINIVRRIAKPTGVKGDLLASQVHVFPNPSNGIFNIDLPTGKTYELVVTDLTGKVIERQQAKGHAQLNLEGTAKGIYLLKVSGENGSAVRKLIIE